MKLVATLAAALILFAGVSGCDSEKPAPPAPADKHDHKPGEKHDHDHR